MKQNPDKVSAELTQMIKEEIKYFEYGQSKINKSKSTYTEILDDKKAKMTVRRNTDNKGNFIGYHSDWVFEAPKYGEKSKQMTYGNSGIENSLPLVLDVE